METQRTKIIIPGKRRIRNDLDLTHKIIYNQIDLEASQLFKFSRRPGLRRLSVKLLQQTKRTHSRRKTFPCRVFKYWNRLPLAVASVQNPLVFKRQLDTYVTHNSAHKSIFDPICSFFVQKVLSRSFNIYKHTFTSI